MSVYVERLHHVFPTASWPYDVKCRMFADTMNELQTMARRLRLRETWLQEPDYGLPHYELPRMKRAEAIMLGAKEITREEYREKFMYVRQRTNG
jgi:hypothetical protein